MEGVYKLFYDEWQEKLLQSDILMLLEEESDFHNFKVNKGNLQMILKALGIAEIVKV